MKKLKSKIAQFILKKTGWTYSVLDEQPPKSIICVAPHTSNWDFIWGKLYYWAIERNAGFIMKKEWFFFPFGLILKKMGGVPTYRGKNKAKGATLLLEKAFSQKENFHIAITPEGKRKAVEYWHKGFYRIACNMNLPIQLAKIDYSNKHISIFKLFFPTGNEEKDIASIRSYYRCIEAKIPHNFIEIK